MQSDTRSEFVQGLTDIVPVIVAACPIGLLWGTLAVGKVSRRSKPG